MATSSSRTRAASIHSAKELRDTKKVLNHSLDDAWNEMRDLLAKQGAHAKQVRVLMEGINGRLAELEEDRKAQASVKHALKSPKRAIGHVFGRK